MIKLYSIMENTVTNNTESTRFTFKKNKYSRVTNPIVVGATFTLSLIAMPQPTQNNAIDPSHTFIKTELQSKKLNIDNKHNLENESNTITKTNSKPSELDLLKRYSKISESKWFKSTYHGLSIGQIIGLEA